MKAPVGKTNKAKKPQAAEESSRLITTEKGVAQFKDNRAETAQLGKIQDMADTFTASKAFPIQQKKNNTGLPDNLKAGIENLSGISMDDVKVHRNSDKPAQLNAHAYAQGNEIHLASGQEKHLPHEAWHVVQQKQGRVKPTKQFRTKVHINDDTGLEKEADVMGAKAANMRADVTQGMVHDVSSSGIETAQATAIDGIVQMYDEDFMKVKMLVDSYSENAYLIQNVNNDGNFNQKLSSMKGYKKLEAADQLKVRTQVKLKIQHKTLNAVEPEDPEDIQKDFDSLKSCVITALMFAEGGTVLGTSSVEELHHILYVQFPKWRQYSDDGVLAQMYQHFGYQTAQFGQKARHSAVTDNDKARGMTSSTGNVGHMVGFRKVGQGYVFRDNDHGEAAMNQHATKNQMVNKIWWK